jgi:hypothetical protein
MRKSTKLSISVALTVAVQYPIYFWLVYQVLKRVEATELMMFLFWVYVPVVIISKVFARLWADENDA